MPTKIVKVPADVAQALVNYLQSRPYAEVHGFMSVFLNMSIVQDVEAPTATPPAVEPEG